MLVYLRGRPAQTILCSATLRSCRPNFPSHPATAYRHPANQSQHWPYNARRWQGSHWSASTPKKSRRKRDSDLGSSALDVDALTTRLIRRLPWQATDTTGRALELVAWCPNTAKGLCSRFWSAVSISPRQHVLLSLSSGCGDTFCMLLGCWAAKTHQHLCLCCRPGQTASPGPPQGLQTRTDSFPRTSTGSVW